MRNALKTAASYVFEAVMLPLCVVALFVLWLADRFQGEYDDDQD